MTDELNIDDILDNVDLLAPHHTTEIQEFLETPDLKSFKKIRNDLLRTQDALDNKVICWNAAFLKALTEDQRNANPSKEFDERVADKKNRQDKLQKSIVTVSKQWGKEIVKHYHWISDTVVQYFTGSHTGTWPEPWLDGSPSFLNLSNEIQQYTKSKRLSSGL